MLGEQPATVVEVAALAIHGMGLVDIVLRLNTGSMLQGRLGPESIPDGLQPGDPVMAMCAANMLVTLRRADAAT